MKAHALFVADVHLCESRPDAAARFFSFLNSTARAASQLYILGDLFETWVGDDCLDSPLPQTVAGLLSDLNSQGVRVFFMHGNRDFMLAQRYAVLCGMTLLDDPVVVDVCGTATLLTHGDALCTDDTAYQRFRRIVRNPLLQKILRALPLWLRQGLASRARAGSEYAKAHKPYAIMDVNPHAVADLFGRHDAKRMIHGHTHRPGSHTIVENGEKYERWVLPDWYGDRGGYIVCDREGCHLIT